MKLGWNENSRTGYKGKPNNCGMVAMSNLGLKVSAKVAQMKGYCPKCGISTRDLLNLIEEQTSTSVWYYGDDKLKSHLTVSEFAKHFPKGLYCVFVRGHVGVIDNGKLLNLDGRKRVMYADRIRRLGTKWTTWLWESRFSITEWLSYKVPDSFEKIHKWLWLVHSEIA